MDVFERLTAGGTSRHSTHTTPKGKKWSVRDFKIGKRLGRGKFGKVYVAMEKRSQFIVALKVISRKEVSAWKVEKQLVREVQVQRKLKHPNILSLYTWFMDNDNIYLVLEYADGGDLYNKGPLPVNKVKPIIRQIMEGLNHLHNAGVAHRDVKAENVLLLKNGQVKVADLGWATHITSANTRRTTLCGTLDYLSPEMVSGQPHGKPVDVWAVGVLMYELLTGKAPFEGHDASTTYQKIIRGVASSDFKIPGSLNESGREFLCQMLTRDQWKRPSFTELLLHPWLNSIE